MAELEARIWGIVGAAFAGAFAVWLLFFPDRVGDFAWVIQPRLAQVFIGAGYVFRTAFFLNVAIWPRWERFRWIFWGNLAFTGTLLLATFWHADRIRWGTVIGHAWLILYVAEPTVMIYLSIGRSLRSPASPSAIPMRRGFIRFLMLEAGLLGMFAALLILNPDFAGTRWPWQLNPMDARIVAAWFVGWAVWAGTMAFAADWREVRAAAFLSVLNGLALLSASLVSIGEFNSPRTPGYLIALGVITVANVWFIWRQERTPAPVAEPLPVPQPG